MISYWQFYFYTCKACAGQGDDPNCLCNEARTAITDQTLLCAAVTDTYEAIWCENHHTCTAFSQCYTQQLESYDLVWADIEAAMYIRQQEYVTAMQANCLMDLIMTAMVSGTPIDHASLVACDDVNVDDLMLSFLDPPPAPASCPVSSDDPKCGDTEWTRIAFSDVESSVFLAWDLSQEAIAELASRATRVKIQERGNPLRSVVSLANSYTIEDIRQGQSIGQGRTLAQNQVGDIWTASDQSLFSHMWNSCSRTHALENYVYHACGNHGGLHWYPGGSKWHLDSTPVNFSPKVSTLF